MTTYTPPKLISRGPSVVEPKGRGTVVVQVLVNADGTFKVVRVLSSTNRGDDAAAMDIAQHSTYAPAVRNGKPVADFYDFSIGFGQNVATAAAAQIDALLHESRWSEAKTAATAALAKNPDDHLVQAQLGVADAYLHDIAGAVEAFHRAGTIPPQYADVAKQAYALNAQAANSTQSAAHSFDAQGVALQQRGNFAAAIQMFEKAAAANAQWAPAEYTRAAILYALMPVHDYLNAKNEAEKAIASDPNYALAYYVAGVAEAENAKKTSNDDQAQDANVDLRKAADLAKQQGLTKLGEAASAFAQNHDADPSLQTWIMQISARLP